MDFFDIPDIVFYCKHSNYHKENGGIFGMVPLKTNPIYTLYCDYSGYLLGVSDSQRAPWGAMAS